MDSIFSLPASVLSYEIQDTLDEDHLSASQVVVERECTTAASPQNLVSSESPVMPQSGIPESTYDWLKDEKEFEVSLPSSIGHYTRKTFIDEFTSAKFTVPAMQTDFNTHIPPQTGEEEVLPVGWTKHTHSDGKPYFYQEHDKIITEEWLYDKDIAERVLRYISIFKDAISKRSESFNRVKSWHIYVEIAEYKLPALEDDDRYRCRYYFVNHDAECIFWLSKCRLDGYLRELRGEMSPDFIRRYLQKEYWQHHYYFSEVHRLTEAQWKSVKKSILLAETDVTMAENTTVSYSIEKLKIMSKTIISAEKLDASEVAAAYMMALLRDHIYNYHGQRDARTGRYDSVYGYNFGAKKRTVPFRTMNLLLFHAPIKYYTSLDNFWVDRLLLEGAWRRLIGQITDKWQQHVGMATILLVANMAFLTRPPVDDKGAGQSVTQILCYLSVASNMTTIITGFLLLNHHNALKNVNVLVATEFLERNWQYSIGFERLSIVYSAPYAFLMWGLVYFLASFFSMCLESANLVSMSFFVGLAFPFGTPLVYLFNAYQKGEWSAW
ncbi:hypothetical protein IW261DRAFT_1606349 [Armillaria novae-zelandiae]|uniref:WW domain-containing protein n=1 Tax=Armillaria novae-zelandiae TaxID=153914 RepID=A0AA39PF69_9AGAR|nr:hypothetical protein IW261DRAFT_1606349 [Armillaria novae-zelandiae]